MPSTFVFEVSSDMRNTRQRALRYEGNDAPTLQQLMDTVRALQEANEQYRREQEWIQQEAKFKQERLMAEAKAEQDMLMTEAKSEQEKLMKKLELRKFLGKIN